MKLLSSKYNVGAKSERTYDGIVFDSALEIKYYKEIVLQGIADGNIVDFELQKTFVLIPSFDRNGKKERAMKYVCDFYIVYKDGRTEVIDIKGMPTEGALIKRKLFMYFHPNENLIWIVYSKKYGGWITYEEYVKFKTEEKKEKKRALKPS